MRQGRSDILVVIAIFLAFSERSTRKKRIWCTHTLLYVRRSVIYLPGSYNWADEPYDRSRGPSTRIMFPIYAAPRLIIGSSLYERGAKIVRARGTDYASGPPRGPLAQTDTQEK